MATLAGPLPGLGRDDRFFLTMALAMAAIVVAGFGLQFAMGRSSFTGSPLHVHVHAVSFFGWVALYVTQNVLVSRGTIALHRRLGWIGAFWAAWIFAVGTYTTVVMVQEGRAPFFFQPAYFLFMNPLSLVAFGALTATAIVKRRQTAWHRRLMYCGMAELTGPALGRLLPAPLLIPYVGWAVFAAVMIWIVIGMIADLRRAGRVHPAWWWGAGVLIVTQIAMSLMAFGPVGVAIYDGVVAGHPGAAVAPLAFPPFPPGP